MSIFALSPPSRAPFRWFNQGRPLPGILSAAVFIGLVLTVFGNGTAVLAQVDPAQPQTVGQPDLTESDPREAMRRESEFLSRTRQLTWEGRRAGESYFSADGRRMIFQSEREPGNPFFQIYVLDLDSGETTRISPGLGKTTCAWFHPSGSRVLYASTQDDPDALQEQQEEIAQRASGKERRYSWDYDQFYDIYDLDLSSGQSRNLTNSRGYDAEGSWSPDGTLITFASNRSALEQPLTPEDQKQFELDPAWANEIYIMQSDGTGVRRLTNTPGYDGGPFFSPDGRRLCWRRFSENGATAEIMTMAVDGSDPQQVTRLQAMSWAPYYHPSGQYLIFTTNRHGFANFELYLTDVSGVHEPVRVTWTPGFDGLPVFTPDGTQLAWTTNRTSNGQSQIFLAEWNHQRALELLGLQNIKAPPSTASESAGVTRARIPETRGPFAPADAVGHVEYLCLPQLGGRLTGTKGEQLATNYVALHFETLGLLPAGDHDTWFQEFEFTSGVSSGPDNRLTDGSHSFQQGTEWRPLAFSQVGEFPAAEAMFAGYGIRAPAAEGFDEYDSFVHLDVRDKWVVAFRFLPEGLTPERRQYLARFSSLRYKAMLARDLGARGLILVSGPTSGVREQLVPLRFDGSLAGTSLPVISVTDELAANWLKHGDRDLESVQKKLDSGDPALGFPIPGLSLAATIDIRQERRKGRNVLGRLQAGDEPAGQIVIVGAHVDHLGAGASGNSLARDDEAGGIHYGADDNASGVAAMLQIAAALSQAREAGTLQARRDVVFAAWSGEELGLLGSSHYVRNLESLFSQHAAGFERESAVESEAPDSPDSEDSGRKSDDGTIPESSDSAATASAATGSAASPGTPVQPAVDPATGPNTGGLNLYIAACLNLDMVGRMQEKLVLQGTGSSSAWQRLVEQANAPLGLALTLQQDSYIPTDASVFFLHGVPILSAFTGNHGEYHTPRDTPEKLNYEGIAQVAHLMSLVCRGLIRSEDPPVYVTQDRPRDGERRASLRAYLGSIPDYASSDTKGVLLSGVAKGAPADNAGVRGGDVIIRLAGRPIENIYDYTYAIEALKIGQEVEIVVLRKGTEVSLKVTPGSRD